jgi:hypothetical protein
VKPLSREGVNAWFDRVVELAKENMLRDGSVAPVAMLLTDRAPKGFKAVKQWARAFDMGFGLALPLPWGTPAGVLWMFTQCGEKARRVVEEARRAAVAEFGMTEQEALPFLVKGIERVVGGPKDIAAAYMRKKIEETGGVYAVIQVHEVWIAQTEGAAPRPDGPVSDMPGRREAVLVMLETSDWGRTVAVPFRREGGREDDHAAKVVGFDAPLDTPGKSEGRFAGLLGEMH